MCVLQALSFLARSIEADPSTVILWVFYLHIYYQKDEGLGKDDMFSDAVNYLLVALLPFSLSLKILCWNAWATDAFSFFFPFYYPACSNVSIAILFIQKLNFVHSVWFAWLWLHPSNARLCFNPSVVHLVFYFLFLGHEKTLDEIEGISYLWFASNWCMVALSFVDAIAYLSTNLILCFLSRCNTIFVPMNYGLCI